VQLESRVFDEPLVDRRSFVDGEVVANQVYRQVRFDLAVDLVEELAEGIDVRC
jgi:hypothetical protein